MKPHNAFLSHNSKDKPLVKKIACRLEDEAKLSVWLDEWNIIPGDPWQEGIESALNDSHCCVVFLGPHGISPWQNEELRDAINDRVSDQSIRVLPVLLPGAHKPKKRDIPKFLKRLDWVSYKEDDAEAFHRLVCGIKGVAPGRFPTDSSSPASSRIYGWNDLPTCSRMPHFPNACFVGRDDPLQTLAAYFWEPDAGETGHAAAIAGIGGVGKTQLACEYVYRHCQRYSDGVFWLSFAEPDLIKGEIAACGQTIGFGSDFSRLPQEEQFGLVKSAWSKPGDRLFIFDNCEDEALFNRWSKAIGKGHILLTTRRQKWSPSLGLKVLALDVLDREASCLLLIKLCENLTLEDAHPIAEALDDLPLALHLAGCYLETFWDAETPDAFLKALKGQNALDHPAMHGEGIEDRPTNHELHVAKTFALSFDKLDQARIRGRYGRKLLCRAACFAPGEHIPRKLLLKTLESKETSDSKRGALGMKRLIELGLMVDMGNENLSLHRLLVAFVKKTLTTEEFAEGKTAVETTFSVEANRLNNARDPRPLSLWSVHLKWVADQSDMNSELSADLCDELGHHNFFIGKYSAAKPYFEKTLVIRRKVLGDAHPETADSLNNLGVFLKTIGEPSIAKPYLEKALAIQKKILGDVHPGTARTLNNLGLLLQEMGKLVAAKPYYEEALAIRIEVLGDAHPDTAISLNNHGGFLRAKGELAAAKPYLEKALAIYKKILGDTHPDTVTSYWNLLLYSDECGNCDSVKELKPALMWLLDAKDEELSADHRTVRDRFAKWLASHEESP